MEINVPALRATNSDFSPTFQTVFWYMPPPPLTHPSWYWQNAHIAEMDILGLPPTQPTSCTSNTAHHPGWVGSLTSQTVTSFQFPDTPSWAICLRVVFLIIPLVSKCLYERCLRLGILRRFRPLSIPLLVTCSLGLTNQPINDIGRISH